MMNKLITLAIFATLSLGLGACGSKQDPAPNNSVSTTTSSTTAVSSTTTVPTSKTTLIGTLRPVYASKLVNLNDTVVYKYESYHVADSLANVPSSPYYQPTTTMMNWVIGVKNDLVVLLNDEEGNYQAYYPSKKDGWWVAITKGTTSGLEVDYISPGEVYFLYPGGLKLKAPDPSRTDLIAVLGSSYTRSCRILITCEK